MSSKEVLCAMKERIEEGENIETEREFQEISKAERQMKIQQLNEKLRQDREALKELKYENIEKNKSYSAKRKITLQKKNNLATRSRNDQNNWINLRQSAVEKQLKLKKCKEIR